MWLSEESRASTCHSGVCPCSESQALVLTVLCGHLPESSPQLCDAGPRCIPGPGPLEEQTWPSLNLQDQDSKKSVLVFSK